MAVKYKMLGEKKMKKEILALILAMVMVVGLSACGGGSNSGKNSGGKDDKGESQQKTDNAKDPEEKGDDGKDAAIGTMVGSGDLGDYHVEIKGAKILEDYEGNPAIVVTYSWTNNSDDTTSAMAAVYEKAFQDGVQLEPAMIIGSDEYESGSSMKEVRPETTIDVQAAFELTSETSVVELEISELISLSDDMVTMDFDPTSLTQ